MRHVLFLCSGNSARSILAEAVMNHPAVGLGMFRGYSAGSHPEGAVHPMAMQVLQERYFPTAGLRSKSWDEFRRPGAPKLDFIVTVCDRAAAECPVWPGQPMVAHWSLPDPALVAGTDAEVRQAFRDSFAALRRRIDLLVALPIASLSRLSLQHGLVAIGRAGALLPAADRSVRPGKSAGHARA